MYGIHVVAVCSYLESCPFTCKLLNVNHRIDLCPPGTRHTAPNISRAEGRERGREEEEEEERGVGGMKVRYDKKFLLLCLCVYVCIKVYVHAY